MGQASSGPEAASEPEWVAELMLELVVFVAAALGSARGLELVSTGGELGAGSLGAGLGQEALVGALLAPGSV